MVSPLIAKVRAKLVRYESTVSSVERVAGLVLVTAFQASQPLDRGDHLALSTSAGRRRFTVCSANDTTFSMLGTVEHDGPAAAWLRQCRTGDRVMFRGPERGWRSSELTDRDLVVCDSSGFGTMLALRGERSVPIMLVIPSASPCGSEDVGQHEDGIEAIRRRWPEVLVTNEVELHAALKRRDGSVWAAGGKPLTDVIRALTRKEGRSARIRTYWASGRTGME
jgi:NADPH-dependent ferric siderophore reductase